MGKFLLKREIDLGKFGWKGCSITLEAPSYNELAQWQVKFKDIDAEKPESQKIIFEAIADKFISGTAKDDKDKVVDITKDDLGDLPLDIVLECIASLRGNVQDPN